MTTELSSVKAGLAIVLLGLFLNIGLGIAFGVNEDGFKDYVAEGVAAHPELHTASSNGRIWRYALRTHFHAGGIAAYSLGLIIFVMFSGLSRKQKATASVLLGLGSFYPLSWLSMFLLAPTVGTAAAHEHFLTQLFTYVGVGGLVAGSSMLVGNLYFGLFGDKAAAGR